jgi:hypothetical protein
MIGLAVLAGVAVYSCFWWLVVRSLPTTRAKAAAVFVALAIPLWDLPFGYFNFLNHCTSDGGVKQLENMPAQKALYFDSLTGIRPEALLKAGLDSVEFRKIGEVGIVRFKRTSSGAMERIEVSSAVSPVRIRSTFNEELSWNLLRHEDVLEDSATGRPIARARDYTWLGGWIQRRTAPMLVPMDQCHIAPSGQLIPLVINGIYR